VSDIAKIIVRRFVLYRNLAGLNQEQLAEKAGLAQPHISGSLSAARKTLQGKA
jgi:transcriptional regulator with XRE-family HTH domain